MRVSIIRGGGVGGLTTRTDLDDSSLRENDRALFNQRLEDAIETSSSPPRQRLPDELQYEITLDSSKTTKTLRYSETDLPEPVRGLINWVDERPERKTSLDQPI
jgi:hypothetical protein